MLAQSNMHGFKLYLQFSMNKIIIGNKVVDNGNKIKINIQIKYISYYIEYILIVRYNLHLLNITLPNCFEKYELV